MDYGQALQYIKECTKFGMKLGLERIHEILRRLDKPQERFPAVHIAGTNGKGSTTAMYEAVLREAGYSVGRFTSPHLSTYRERFVVDGRMIDPSELAELITELKPVLDSVGAAGFGPPTEFEVGTALAFLFFARRKVDIALVEVGMGGRFDATNVLVPLFSVITHIDLDHQQYLGDTLEKIAFEKAGIIKPGVPVVIGLQEPGIEAYLQEIAISRNSPCRLASAIEIRNLRVSETGTVAKYLNTSQGDLEIAVSLIGQHQARNCLNLLAGLELLRCAGFTVSREQLVAGLAHTVWPGRFERVLSFPELQIYLDGAHNPDGANALTGSWLAVYPGRKGTLLVGIQNNRPLKQMAEILAPIAEQVVVTTVPDANSSPEALASYFAAQGLTAWVEPEPEAALEKALSLGNPLVLACGSLYLIGKLRSIILQTGD